MNLTKAIFDEYIDTIYRAVFPGGQTVELKLIKCAEKSSPGMEGFYLIFEGAVDQLLDDNTYTFHHDHMESFHLFISPYRRDGDKIYYDAHFTRIVE